MSSHLLERTIEIDLIKLYSISFVLIFIQHAISQTASRGAVLLFEPHDTGLCCKRAPLHKHPIKNYSDSAIFVILVKSCAMFPVKGVRSWKMLIEDNRCWLANITSQNVFNECEVRQGRIYCCSHAHYRESSLWCLLHSSFYWLAPNISPAAI